MTVHGVAGPVAGLVVGVAVNYALWRGSPDVSNLAVWRTVSEPPADPAPARTAAMALMLVVLIVGGAALALGIEGVAGVPTTVVVLVVAGVAFAAVAATDYRGGRVRNAAFYAVATVMFGLLVADSVASTSATADAVIGAATFAVLGYFLADVLDRGLPDRTTPE